MGSRKGIVIDFGAAELLPSNEKNNQNY